MITYAASVAPGDARLVDCEPLTCDSLRFTNNESRPLYALNLFNFISGKEDQ
jgi:hypothetical protein